MMLWPVGASWPCKGHHSHSHWIPREGGDVANLLPTLRYPCARAHTPSSSLCVRTSVPCPRTGLWIVGPLQHQSLPESSKQSQTEASSLCPPETTGQATAHTSSTSQLPAPMPFIGLFMMYHVVYLHGRINIFLLHLSALLLFLSKTNLSNVYKVGCDASWEEGRPNHCTCCIFCDKAVTGK